MDYVYSSCNRISKRAAVRREQDEPGPLSHFTVCRHGRFWAVQDASGELVCLTVYKRGAEEVTRRLECQEAWILTKEPHNRPTPGET